MTEVRWLHSEQKYAWEAMGWATDDENGPHLDNIGSNDMLRDFHQYAINRHRLGNAPEDFKLLWEAFQRSETWYHYYPNQRPITNWHRVDEKDFEENSWKAARITCVRGEKGMTEMFYEVTEKWEGPKDEGQV